IQNPIAVSVPGYPDSKLSVKVKGAEVTKTADGHFDIYFDKAPKGNAYAYVDATNEEGTTSTVASLLLKAKELPAPTATIAGTNGGYIRLRDLRRANGITAALADEDFDMQYKIVSYKLSLLHDRNSIYIEPVK